MLEKDDVAILQKLILDENFSKTHEVEDMLVFLGDTGVGKSTVITYLLGYNLAWSKKDRRMVFITEPAAEENYPKAAKNSTKSCTIYAETFRNYCDCPGFEETRGTPYSICASISTEIAIKSAKSIKGIVVVLNWAGLSRTKYAGLITVAKTLAKIIPSFNENEIRSSLFFVVNNNPNSDQELETEKEIAEEALELRKDIANGERKIKGASKQEYEKIILLLGIIGSEENNILIVDIKDKGESRQKFLEKIKTSPHSIRKSDFHFDDYDESRCIFDKEVENQAYEGSILLKDYLNCIDNKRKNEEMIINFQNQNKFSDEMQSIVNRFNGINLTENEECKKIIIIALDKSIHELEQAIRKNSIALQQQETQFTNIKKQLTDHDKEELVTLWKKIINEKRMPIFGWLANTDEILSYRGTPFKKENICETCNDDTGGQLSHIQIIPDKGIYQARYESALGEEGKATVEIKIESKIFYKHSIDLWKKELINVNSKIEQLTNNICSLNAKKDSIIKFKETINEENSDNIQKEIKSFTGKLNTKVTEELEASSHKEQQFIEKIAQKIKEKEIWFNLIIRVNKCLQYEAPIIQIFLQLYQEYLTNHKLEEVKNTPFYAEMNQLQNSIDQKIISIVKTNNNLEEIKKCSELLAGYLNGIKKYDTAFSVEKYQAYQVLCQIWLITEVDEPSKIQRSKNFIQALSQLHTAFQGNLLDENIIDIILCNELEKEYLTRDAIISILQQYKAYFKDSLEENCLLGTPHWIVLSKIMQCISHEQEANYNFLMSLLKEFLSLASTPGSLQKLLLINNHNLLRIICEKKETVSNALLGLFTEKNQLPAEVYVHLIKHKKTNLFRTYFNSDTEIIHKINASVHGRTFLSFAVEANDPTLVRYLLSKGAVCTYSIRAGGYSPFYLAVIKSHLEIIEIFTKNPEQIENIVVHSEAQTKQNIFHLIFLNNTGKNYEILDHFWKVIPTNSRKKLMLQADVKGYIPLHYAVQCCDAKIIDFWGEGVLYGSKHTSFTVEDMTACLNKQTLEGNTGLHLAVMSKSPEVVQNILSLKGIKLYIENNKKQTALTIALELQIPDIIAMLSSELKVQFIKNLKKYLSKYEAFIGNIEKALSSNHEIEFTEIKEYILQLDLTNSYTFRDKLISYLKQKIETIMQENHSMKDDPGFCLNLLRDTIMKVDRELLQSSSMVSLFNNHSQALKTLKQKAFCRALKDSLVEYYFISRALYENAIDPASGIFDEIKGTAETLAPAIAGATGIVGGLLATGGIAIMKFISFVKDKNTRWQASRFVEAFGVAGPMAVNNAEKGIRIDHNKLSAVANALYKRYRDQIEQCTLSMTGQEAKQISLAKTDGIAVLAQCIADRIFKHIINEGSINSQQEKSYGSKFWDAVTSIGDKKDIYVETSNFSIIERCIFALFKEDEGKDFEVLTEDVLIDSKKRKWQVGGILVKTGLKISDTDDGKDYKFYIRVGDNKARSLHDEYGFCYIEDPIECHRRGYTHRGDVEDKFADSKISNAYHKSSY